MEPSPGGSTGTYDYYAAQTEDPGKPSRGQITPAWHATLTETSVRGHSNQSGIYTSKDTVKFSGNKGLTPSLYSIFDTLVNTAVVLGVVRTAGLSDTDPAFNL